MIGDYDRPGSIPQCKHDKGDWLSVLPFIADLHGSLPMFASNGAINALNKSVVTLSKPFSREYQQWNRVIKAAVKPSALQLSPCRQSN